MRAIGLTEPVLSLAGPQPADFPNENAPACRGARCERSLAKSANLRKVRRAPADFGHGVISFRHLLTNDPRPIVRDELEQAKALI
jgi:hypothetical protein